MFLLSTWFLSATGIFLGTHCLGARRFKSRDGVKMRQILSRISAGYRHSLPCVSEFPHGEVRD
jgi:hypothetical protein